MARDARTTIVLELVSEFVEDHVRQAPDQPFGMADLRVSLGGMLEEAGLLVDIRPADDQWVSDWLDRHPLLQRHTAGTAAWKPGFNKGALRRDQSSLA